MKRFLLGLAIVFLIGCAKRSNNDQELTIVDFENALAASYNFLGVFGDYYLPMSTLSSDEMGIPGFGANLSNTTALTEIITHQWTPTNDLGSILWTELYNGVNAANSALALASQLNEDVSTRAIAEAKALRAFNYFLLLDLFGNILTFEEDVLQGNVNIPQLSRAEVFNFVEAELQEALPDLGEEVNYGFITKDVVQTLLAKLYLNAEVYTGTPDWAACRTACEAVISGGHYSLSMDYFDLFAVNNSSSGSSEIILASTESPVIHPSRLSVHPAQIDTKNPSTSGFFNYAATPEMVQSFDLDNDQRAEALLRGVQRTTAGAVILDAAADTVQYSLLFRGGNPYLNGYRVLKYALDPTKTNYGDNDIPILRYADVLLMKAEALNELDDLQGAIDLINQVRARAYQMASPLEATDFNKQSLRMQILEERTNELFWEGWRRQDLIRHDAFCAPWTQKESGTDDCQIRALFPIPSSALNLNTNLVQNPGY